MRTVKKIADLQVGNLSDLEASIPAAIANAGGTIEIELRIPKATSPEGTWTEFRSAHFRERKIHSRVS